MTIPITTPNMVCLDVSRGWYPDGDRCGGVSLLQTTLDCGEYSFVCIESHDNLGPDRNESERCGLRRLIRREATDAQDSRTIGLLAASLERAEFDKPFAARDR